MVESKIVHANERDSPGTRIPIKIPGARAALYEPFYSRKCTTVENTEVRVAALPGRKPSYPRSLNLGDQRLRMA